MADQAPTPPEHGKTAPAQSTGPSDGVLAPFTLSVAVPGRPDPVLVEVDPATFEIRHPDEVRLMATAHRRYTGPPADVAAAGAIAVVVARALPDVDPSEVLAGVAAGLDLEEVTQ